jgi:hypothetical protein
MIIDKLKIGARVTRDDWDREKAARTELLKCRDLLARLDRFRKLAEDV